MNAGKTRESSPAPDQETINGTKEYLWTEWEFIALQNENGVVFEIQGIGVNVTDKVRAEEMKKEASVLHHMR